MWPSIYLFLIFIEISVSNKTVELGVGIEDYPYMVNIVRLAPTYDCVCDGTVLSERWILTAAHCMVDNFESTQLLVVAGLNNCYDFSDDRQEMSVQSYFSHPDYDISIQDDVANVLNDIAVVRLAKSLRYGPKVRPVRLLTPDKTEHKNITDVIGTKCQAIGFSFTSLQPVLNTINISLIVTDNCTGMLKSQNINVNRGGVVCTLDSKAKKRFCGGDSVGSLVCSGYQVGISSGGIGCSREDLPDVWTRVDVYHNWIVTAIGTSIKYKQRSNPAGVNKLFFSWMIFVYVNVCVI